MTSGSYTRNYPRSASGVNGPLGETFTKTWSGVDSPAFQEKSSRKAEYRVRTFPVNKNGKIVEVTRRDKFPTYYSPPKRARPDKKTDNPYSMTATYSKIGTFDLRPGETWSTSQAGYAVNLQPPEFTANDQIALMGKLRQKVAGSDFNLGVTAAESKEASAMILQSAQKIRAAINLARNRRYLDAAVALTGERHERTRKKYADRAVAKNWLELQYGWLPLLSDVQNAAQFLAHHHAYPSQNVVRVSHKVGGGSYSPVGPVLRPRELTGYSRKTIKATLTEKDVAQLLGLQDPLAVAWELIPYSFVVDWFIPISNFLSARMLNHSLSGVFVTSHKTVQTASGLVLAPGAGSDSLDYVQSYTSFSRSVAVDLPVPFPRFNTPAQIFGWRRAANAVALLVNLAPRKRDSDRSIEWW